ncbi:MAG: hypothetical protein AB1762_06140 [Gemmatimonadota bacterium]
MATPTARPPAKSASPATQLKTFIAKFAPKHQALLRAVRSAMRKRFPTAHEIVYDDYNFFVIAYGPTGRPSDCIISIAAGASGVGLCFLYGAKLKDSDKILLGSGNQTRFIRVPSVGVLAQPAVQRLVDAAESQSRVPFAATGRGTLIIKSVSKKQRPRR